MNKKFAESFGWDIETRPVSFVGRDGNLVSDNNYKMIIRNDNESVLSVMKKAYCPMSIANFEESAHRMAEISGFPLLGFQEFKDGQITLAILENTQENLQIGDFPIKDYLVMGSSFNGDKPFFVGTSTILIRCENAFSRINTIESVRHTKNSPQRREVLFGYLQNYFEERKQLYAKMTDMLSVPVNEAQKVNFVREVLAIPELVPGKELHSRTVNRIEELTQCIDGEMKDVGENVFGLFQGVTKYTTHHLKSRTEGSFGNLLGTADLYNQKAFGLSVKLLESA